MGPSSPLNSLTSRCSCLFHPVSFIFPLAGPHNTWDLSRHGSLAPCGGNAGPQDHQSGGSAGPSCKSPILYLHPLSSVHPTNLLEPSAPGKTLHFSHPSRLRATVTDGPTHVLLFTRHNSLSGVSSVGFLVSLEASSKQL